MAAVLVLAMVAGVAIWQWNLTTVALTQMERTHTIAVEAVARNVAVVEGLANPPGSPSGRPSKSSMCCVTRSASC
jgi:hypothetical protein